MVEPLALVEGPTWDELLKLLQCLERIEENRSFLAVLINVQRERKPDFPDQGFRRSLFTELGDFGFGIKGGMGEKSLKDVTDTGDQMHLSDDQNLQLQKVMLALRKLEKIEGSGAEKEGLVFLQETNIDVDRLPALFPHTAIEKIRWTSCEDDFGLLVGRKKFTPESARELFERIVVDLDAQSITKFEEDDEGWIARLDDNTIKVNVRVECDKRKVKCCSFDLPVFHPEAGFASFLWESVRRNLPDPQQYKLVQLELPGGDTLGPDGKLFKKHCISDGDTLTLVVEEVDWSVPVGILNNLPEEPEEPLFYPNQAELAGIILERMQQVCGKPLDQFDGLKYMIWDAPNLKVLEDQTKRRTQDWEESVEIESGGRSVCRLMATEVAAMRKFLQSAKDSKDKLHVLIVDECHWAIGKGCLHDTWLNKEAEGMGLKDSPNFVQLLVSATPYNCLTEDSRIPSSNVIQWNKELNQRGLYVRLEDSARTYTSFSATQKLMENCEEFSHVRRIWSEVSERKDKSTKEKQKETDWPFMALVLSYFWSLVYYKVVRFDSKKTNKEQSVRSFEESKARLIELKEGTSLVETVDRLKEVFTSEAAVGILKQHSPRISTEILRNFVDTFERRLLLKWIDEEHSEEDAKEMKALLRSSDGRDNVRRDALHATFSSKLKSEQLWRSGGGAVQDLERFTGCDKVIGTLLSHLLPGDAREDGQMVVLRVLVKESGSIFQQLFQYWLQHAEFEFCHRDGRRFQAFSVVCDFGGGVPKIAMSIPLHFRPGIVKNICRRIKREHRRKNEEDSKKAADLEVGQLADKLVTGNSSEKTHVLIKAIGGYRDLESIPCMLLVCNKGRMGETFPPTLACLDVRFRPPEMMSTAVQELGRICRRAEVGKKIRDIPLAEYDLYRGKVWGPEGRFHSLEPGATEDPAVWLPMVDSGKVENRLCDRRFVKYDMEAPYLKKIGADWREFDKKTWERFQRETPDAAEKVHIETATAGLLWLSADDQNFPCIVRGPDRGMLAMDSLQLVAILRTIKEKHPAASVELYRLKRRLPFVLLRKATGQKFSSTVLQKAHDAAKPFRLEWLPDSKFEVMSNLDVGLDGFMNLPKSREGPSFEDHLRTAAPKPNNYDHGSGGENVWKNRLLLWAEPQIGKTGTYLSVLDQLIRPPKARLLIDTEDPVSPEHEAERIAAFPVPHWKVSSLSKAPRFRMSSLGEGKYHQHVFNERLARMRSVWTKEDWLEQFITQTRSEECVTENQPSDQFLNALRSEIGSRAAPVTFGDGGQQFTVKDEDALGVVLNWDKRLFVKKKQSRGSSGKLSVDDYLSGLKTPDSGHELPKGPCRVNSRWNVEDLPPAEEQVTSAGGAAKYRDARSSDLITHLPAPVRGIEESSAPRKEVFALASPAWSSNREFSVEMSLPSGSDPPFAEKRVVFVPSHRKGAEAYLDYDRVLKSPEQTVFCLVVREDLFRAYTARFGAKHVVIQLPKECGEGGITAEAGGIGFARRFIQALASSWGLEWCWMLDDNISQTFLVENIDTREPNRLVQCRFDTVMEAVERQVAKCEEPLSDHEKVVDSTKMILSAEGISEVKLRKRSQEQDCVGFASSKQLQRYTGPPSAYGMVGIGRNPERYSILQKRHKLTPAIYSMVYINVKDTVEQGLLYPIKPYWEDVEWSHMLDKAGLVVMKYQQFQHLKIQVKGVGRPREPKNDLLLENLKRATVACVKGGMAALVVLNACKEVLSLPVEDSPETGDTCERCHNPGVPTAFSKLATETLFVRFPPNTRATRLQTRGNLSLCSMILRSGFHFVTLMIPASPGEAFVIDDLRPGERMDPHEYGVEVKGGGISTARDYELYLGLYASSQSDCVPLALTNKDNSCYLDAALQMCWCCPAFRAAFQKKFGCPTPEAFLEILVRKLADKDFSRTGEDVDAMRNMLQKQIDKKNGGDAAEALEQMLEPAFGEVPSIPTRYFPLKKPLESCMDTLLEGVDADPTRMTVVAHRRECECVEATVTLSCHYVATAADAFAADGRQPQSPHSSAKVLSTSEMTEVVATLKKIKVGFDDDPYELEDPYYLYKLFLEPGSRSKYYDKIKDPICLRDIEAKLSGGKYSVSEFERDFNLMIDNALKYALEYNDKEAHEDAVLLRKHFKSEMEKARRKSKLRVSPGPGLASPNNSLSEEVRAKILGAFEKLPYGPNVVKRRRSELTAVLDHDSDPLQLLKAASLKRSSCGFTHDALRKLCQEGETQTMKGLKTLALAVGSDLPFSTPLSLDDWIDRVRAALEKANVLSPVRRTPPPGIDRREKRPRPEADSGGSGRDEEQGGAKRRRTGVSEEDKTKLLKLAEDLYQERPQEKARDKRLKECKAVIRFDSDPPQLLQGFVQHKSDEFKQNLMRRVRTLAVRARDRGLLPATPARKMTIEALKARVDAALRAADGDSLPKPQPAPKKKRGRSESFNSGVSSSEEEMTIEDLRARVDAALRAADGDSPAKPAVVPRQREKRDRSESFYSGFSSSEEEQRERKKRRRSSRNRDRRGSDDEDGGRDLRERDPSLSFREKEFEEDEFHDASNDEDEEEPPKKTKRQVRSAAIRADLLQIIEDLCESVASKAQAAKEMRRQELRALLAAPDHLQLLRNVAAFKGEDIIAFFTSEGDGFAISQPSMLAVKKLAGEAEAAGLLWQVKADKAIELRELVKRVGTLVFPRRREE